MAYAAAPKPVAKLAVSQADPATAAHRIHAEALGEGAGRTDMTMAASGAVVGPHWASGSWPPDPLVRTSFALPGWKVLQVRPTWGRWGRYALPCLAGR